MIISYSDQLWPIQSILKLCPHSDFLGEENTNVVIRANSIPGYRHILYFLWEHSIEDIAQEKYNNIKNKLVYELSKDPNIHKMEPCEFNIC